MRLIGIGEITDEELEHRKKLLKAPDFDVAVCRSCPHIHVFPVDENGKALNHFLISVEELLVLIQAMLARTHENNLSSSEKKH